MGTLIIGCLILTVFCHAVNIVAREELLRSVEEKFVRYVVIDTQSKEEVETIPSTQEQFVLARLLEKELHALGLQDVRVDEKCYVYAALPATNPQDAEKVPVVGFIAHLDTAPAISGKDVKPVIHRNYQGGNLVLPGDPEQVLTPEGNKNLKEVIGSDIITSDGTTLLGADDKAGVAAIMAAMEYLVKHPEIPHGTVKIAFTPDEEVGKGAEGFDVKGFGAKFAYTIDGEQEGELNIETFNASSATVVFQGKNVHPGYAKGVMVNSLYALSHFISLFPDQQKPETTEGREGYLHPYDLRGREESSTVKVLLRDFDADGLAAKKNQITEMVERVKTAFPKVQVKLSIDDSYKNMYTALSPIPYIVEFAEEAMKRGGVTPFQKPIRGGTDGARLSFMGLPCANIFCGAENVHGRQEWVSITSMAKSSETIIHLINMNFERAVQS